MTFLHIIFTETNVRIMAGIPIGTPVAELSPDPAQPSQAKMGAEIALDSGCCLVVWSFDCHVFAQNLLQPILSLLIAKPGLDRPNQAMPDQTILDQTSQSKTRPDQTRPDQFIQYSTKPKLHNIFVCHRWRSQICIDGAGNTNSVAIQ